VGKSTLGTLVVLAIIALSTASYTVAAEPPEYLKSFGPDGTEATEFSRVGSVAVDEQSHAVYVTDRSK
jgi:hypothetical protein